MADAPHRASARSGCSPRPSCRILGPHNVANALAAALAARLVGRGAGRDRGGAAQLRRARSTGWSRWAERGGVLWINDSKATNVAVHARGAPQPGPPDDPAAGRASQGRAVHRAAPRHGRRACGGCWPSARRASGSRADLEGRCPVERRRGRLRGGDAPRRAGSPGPATPCSSRRPAPASTCSPTTRSAATRFRELVAGGGEVTLVARAGDGPRAGARSRRAGTAVAAPAPRPGRRGAAEGWEPGALVLLVLLMFSFGLVELYSASSFMAQSEGLPAHFYAAAAGGRGSSWAWCSALLVARLDYRRLQRPRPGRCWGSRSSCCSWWCSPGTEAIAPRVNGARRWLRLGITFQPSELAKLALIVWTAALAVKKQDRLHSLRKGLLPFLVVWLRGAPAGGAAAELLRRAPARAPRRAGALRRRRAHRALHPPRAWSPCRCCGTRSRARATGCSASSPSSTPPPTSRARSYQIHQSLIAVGSGGITGRGLRREPAEVRLPARAPQRLPLLHDRRGVGAGRASSSPWLLFAGLRGGGLPHRPRAPRTSSATCWASG